MRKNRKAIPFVIAASAMLLLVACSGGGDGSSSESISSDPASSSSSESGSASSSSESGSASSSSESGSASSSSESGSASSESTSSESTSSETSSEEHIVVADASMDGSYSLYTSGNATTSFDAIDAAAADSTKTGATGVYDLTGIDFEKKTEVLGKLEEYAIDNTITGIPLYQTDSYVMYNSRVTKGTENYITGYGFDILRTGRLGSATVGNDDYPTYYHTWNASNPNSIAYWDDSGSEVSSLNSYISASYFGTKMNDDKNGYDWYGVLSTYDRPFLVQNAGEENETVTYGGELDLSVTGDTWRVYVRTGEDGGVAYRTGSSLDDRKAYDGRYSTLDDYLTAFKLLLNGKYAYYRGNELASSTGASAIEGASAYYQATATLDPWDEAAETAFESLGVKGGTDERGDYIQITLGSPVNRFYGMYYITSTFYEPVPMDFFKLVTNNGEEYDNWGKYNSSRTTTIVDNVLSVGPFYLEAWNDGEIVYARNDNWWEKVEDSSLYQIPGVYIDILTAYNSDNTAAIKEFLANNLDAAGLPQTYINDYKDDPRTVSVPGYSVFKLNMNTCTQEYWNELFGDEGSVSIQGDNAWTCKPWMADDNFVKGLFFSIDRNTFAASRGYAASINYFSDDYLSNPEEGTSYNSTDAHAAALEDFWGDTISTAGYSLTQSQNQFNTAIDTLLASGDISDGDTLTINAWWMYASQEDTAEEIASYMENAFNTASNATAHSLTLNVVNEYVSTWSDVYYAHLLVGKFDLGFGSISGNSLDPLNFMEILKSDNSSGFTLNWGPDTTEIGIKYDADGDGVEEDWSFDNLWAASDHGVVLYKGIALPPFVLTCTGKKDGEDGAIILDFTYEDCWTHLIGLNETNATALAAQVVTSYSFSPNYIILTDNYTFQNYYAGPVAAAYYGCEVGTFLSGDESTNFGISNVETDSGENVAYSGSFSVTFTKAQMLASAQAQLEEGSSTFLSVYLYGSAGISSSSTAYVNYDFIIDYQLS